MKRIQMQKVVDYVNVQSDYLWEFINDKNTSPEDKTEFLNDLNSLCSFMLEAREKGFNVDNSCYALDKKMAMLSSRV